jgi:hypothetical protein
MSETEFQLRKLISYSMDSFDAHQWPDENLRWTELLISLLSVQHRKFAQYTRDIIRTQLNVEQLYNFTFLFK